MAKKKIEEPKNETLAVAEEAMQPTTSSEPNPPAVPAHLGAGSLGPKGQFTPNTGATVSGETVTIRTSAHLGARMYLPDGCIHFDAAGEAVVPRDIAERVKGFDPSISLVL